MLLISRRFALFVISGGIAAGVNFGSRIMLSQWMAFLPAIVVAYGLGMATAFVLNRVIVFDAGEGRLGRQIAWFLAVNAAAVLQTVAVSFLLARVVLPALGVGLHVETIAHAVGVAVPVVTSYFGHKHFSFARKDRVGTDPPAGTGSCQSGSGDADRAGSL